jgi:CheY-like chemotaxis protein
LDQVVINLCANARDAVAGVGKVTIETRNATTDQDPACRNEGKAPGHYVALVICDNGSGMSPETKAHLFEPFFTTKALNKGTGLGLATVYGIVQQNHGFIDVRSEPGDGTTFTIYLPRHAEPVASAAFAEPETPTPGGSESLLLVEDEPALLNLGKLMLERLGYSVLAAGTPEEALHLAEAHRGRIDLLITDVIMPGMNGRELSRRVRSMYPGLGVVFVSGYTADIIAQHGVLDADVYFLQKPFLIRTLALKVREALDAGQG